MAQSRDRRVVLWILGGMVALIVAFSIFSPANDDSNPIPTTYNSGSAGTKAAYLASRGAWIWSSALGVSLRPI